MKKYIPLCDMTTFFLNFFIIFIIAFLVIPSVSLAQDPYTEKAPMPTARLGFGTAVVFDVSWPKIYVIGGLSTETKPLSVVEVYDPLTDKWDTTKAPMPTARGGLGCAVVDGKIYAIGGGHPDPSILNTLEVYDPASDNWDTTKADMKIARANVAVSAVNGKIYVIGGSKGGPGIWEGLSTVEEYDPVTDTWTFKKDKPTPGWSLRTCVIDGKIYATGGNIKWPNITAVLEVYDPLKDEWDTTRTPMPEPKYSHATCAFNGNIYSFGGWNNCATGPMYKKVYVYNPITDEWSPKTDMPLEIGELSAVTVGDKIYLFGGTSTLHPFTSIGSVYEYDPASDPPTRVENVSLGRDIPTEFLLHQNYPNPFNPETRISYEVTKHEQVILRVINLRGQHVRTLVNEEKPAGFYEVTWDGKNDRGRRVASGVYLYRLTSNDFVQTKKMLFLQ